MKKITRKTVWEAIDKNCEISLKFYDKFDDRFSSYYKWDENISLETFLRFLELLGDEYINTKKVLLPHNYEYTVLLENNGKYLGEERFTLSIKNKYHSYAILSLTAEGTIRRHNYIPFDTGLTVDDSGRIIICD